MRVLILGGTRFLGPAVVRALLARGDAVTLLTRGRAPDPFGAAVGRLACDRDDTARFSALAGSRDWDGVVDLSAYRGDQTGAAIAALRRTGRFVHVSSTIVHGGSTAPYAAGKRACEEQLAAAAGFPFVIVRPPIVQGPGDHTGRAAGYAAWLRSGAVVDLPDGGAQRFQHVFVDDVGKAVAASLTAGPHVLGRAYDVAQRETPSLREYLQSMARCLGVTPRFRSVPQTQCDAALRARHPFFEFGAGDQLVDITAAVRDLGFAPTPMATWLPLVVRALGAA